MHMCRNLCTNLGQQSEYDNHGQHAVVSPQHHPLVLSIDLLQAAAGGTQHNNASFGFPDRHTYFLTVCRRPLWSAPHDSTKLFIHSMPVTPLGTSFPPLVVGRRAVEVT